MNNVCMYVFMCVCMYVCIYLLDSKRAYLLSGMSSFLLGRAVWTESNRVASLHGEG